MMRGAGVRTSASDGGWVLLQTLRSEDVWSADGRAAARNRRLSEQTSVSEAPALGHLWPGSLFPVLRTEKKNNPSVSSQRVFRLTKLLCLFRSTGWRTPSTSWRTSLWRERPTSLRSGWASTRGWESCPVLLTTPSGWTLTSEEARARTWSIIKRTREVNVNLRFIGPSACWEWLDSFVQSLSKEKDGLVQLHLKGAAAACKYCFNWSCN